MCSLTCAYNHSVQHSLDRLTPCLRDCCARQPSRASPEPRVRGFVRSPTQLALLDQHASQLWFSGGCCRAQPLAAAWPRFPPEPRRTPLVAKLRWRENGEVGGRPTRQDEPMTLLPDHQRPWMNQPAGWATLVRRQPFSNADVADFDTERACSTPGLQQRDPTPSADRRIRAASCVDHDGNRYLDPLQPARPHQPRASASQGRRRDRRPGTRRLDHRRARPRQRGRGPRAARLITATGAGGVRQSVFFTNGGADANENAIRLARLARRPATRSSRATAPTTATPAPRSSPPATGDASPTSTPAGTSTSSVPTLYRTRSSGPRPRGGVRPSALHHPRAGHPGWRVREHRRGDSPGNAFLGTAGRSTVPPRRAASAPASEGVSRPVRDPAHPRRGDGRLRPDRPAGSPSTRPTS